VAIIEDFEQRFAFGHHQPGLETEIEFRLGLRLVSKHDRMLQRLELGVDTGESIETHDIITIAVHDDIRAAFPGARMMVFQRQQCPQYSASFWPRIEMGTENLPRLAWSRVRPGSGLVATVNSSVDIARYTG
jgi:hypothetical protein